jgi:hypothetical protein
MNMQQLKGFVSLEHRKRDLDAELKQIKQQLDDLERLLVPQFIEDGVQKLTVDGRTVSVGEDIYASPLRDREEVVAALGESGLGQYITPNYNANSLTAFVREVAREVKVNAEAQGAIYDEDDVFKALPPRLADALKISFVHVLRSRQA